MMLVNGIPGRLVPCASVFGVRPPDFAALGSQPSPLANDLPSLADRADAQWLWVLKTPLIGSGTSAADDNGGYELVDAADGTWTQGYRGLVMPLSGATQVYEAAITVTVGGGAGVGLAISDGGHLHAADNLSFAAQLALAPQDGWHVHAADEVVLSAAPYLSPADASHAHAADGVALSTASWLSAADGLHAHLADRPTLVTSGPVVIDRTPLPITLPHKPARKIGSLLKGQ